MGYESKISNVLCGRNWTNFNENGSMEGIYSGKIKTEISQK